jgi:hypothetical protein
MLEVVFDPKTAPKPEGPLSVPAAPVYRKLALVKASTQLAKARFGSPDYDRWAFIYGRLEESPPPATLNNDGPKTPRRARLVTAGDVLVVFVAEPE